MSNLKRCRVKEKIRSYLVELLAFGGEVDGYKRLKGMGEGTKG